VSAFQSLNATVPLRALCVTLAAALVVMTVAIDATVFGARADAWTAVTQLGCKAQNRQASHQSPCATKRTTPTPAMAAALAHGLRVDIGGYYLFITCIGTGNPTVVMEAGASGDSREWQPVLPAIGRASRVCTYDRAGMGRSDPRLSPPAQQATVRDAVRELHKLLLAVGLSGRLVLVGHSFGGAIALQYTYTYPDDVGGLVMVDPAYPEGCRDAEARGVVPCGSDTYLNVPKSFTQLLSSIPHHKLVGSLGARPLIVLYHGVKGAVNGPAISQIEDLWPKRMKHLARASSNRELVLAPNSPHDIPHYAPQLIAGAIREVVEARHRPGLHLARCGQTIAQYDGVCVPS
jgi:pimeloyl-ACP methyl ester carboxylesterase